MRLFTSGKNQAAKPSPPARYAIAQRAPKAVPGPLPRRACACGGACPRCNANTTAQPMLRVGPADDRYEREAERIATALTSATPAAIPARGVDVPHAQRLVGSTAKSDNALADDAARQLGAGQPLDAAARGFFETRLGHDLSRVRVHTGAAAAASAQQLGARAYTMGRDVVFGAGEYAPGSSGGRHLLAHELVHVVQQGAAAASVAPPAAETPPRRQRLALAPGAFSLRLTTEEGERFIGPPEPELAGSVDTRSPSAEPEERATETVPVQRMPQAGRANDPGTLWIQRTATFTNPTATPQDPLARLGLGLTPGLTTPTINGSKMTNNQQIETAISPTQVGQAGSSGGNVTCQFAGLTIDTSAEQIVAAAAGAGGWSGKVPPASIGNPAACAKVAQVPVTMNAQPSNADFVKRVQTSENEHVAEIRALHNRHIVPYDKFVTALRGSGPSLQDCSQNLLAQMNHQQTQAAYAFTYGYAAATKKLDGPGGTHSDDAAVKTAKDCSSATITLSQSNATIAGAAPGNVVTVAPTVVNFDPKTLKAVGTDLVDGKTTVKSFSSAADATAALAVIQHYGMNSRNTIGAMEYFLVGAAAPSGALKGANEFAINPAAYQVTLNLPNAGDWAVTDIVGSAPGININVVVNFGAKRNEAYSGWAVMTSLGVTAKGWVGGTRQAPTMTYFRT